MGLPLPEIVQCPVCRAENPAVEESCQTCGKPLAIDIGPAPRLPRRFGLGSLMILIALIAVGLGLTRELPGLGIPFLILSVPAMGRTLGWTAIRETDGRPMTTAETLSAFLTSFCLVLMMAFGAGFAFITIGFLGLCCGAGVRLIWSGAPSDEVAAWGYSVGASLGAVAAIYTLYRMGRAFWNEWE